MVYLWTKSLHLLFVMAWMASVFYLPRILVNLAEAGSEAAVRERLLLMAKRLYSFGHSMFGMAVVLGALLWQGYRAWPQVFPDMVGGRHWIDAKLALVLLLLVYFVACGRLLKRARAGAALPSSTALRWINELPELLLLAVIYLALARPF